MALAPWSEQSRCAGVGGLPYHRAAEAERGNAQAAGGMHVLARGDVLQRLRLASGLVLLTFAATHFLNHALGLVSLEAMQGMQAWRKVVTRSWLGSGVLLAAFLIHIALALYKISRRLTWRLPVWEAAQILTGLSIPLFLITHIVYNRGAASLAGTDDTYAYELGNIWPALAWEHSLLLLVVWVHGCIGLHYWLSLARWYRRLQPVLLALAVALPVSALAGFSVAGRQMAARLAEPGAWDRLQAASRARRGGGCPARDAA
jgi:adenylate cyclase